MNNNDIPFSPKNTAIAWDLHGTLVKRDNKQTIAYIWQAFKNHSRPVILLLKIPFILYGGYCISKHIVTYDQFLTLLCKKYSILLEIKQYLWHALNAYKLAEGSVEIVHVIKNAGYFQILSSNINNKSLEYLKKEHPTLFTAFNAECLPFYDAFHNHVIGKPSLLYLTALAQTIHTNQPNASLILFIDDKKENIKSAQQANNNSAIQKLNITFHTMRATPNKHFYEQVHQKLLLHKK